MQTNKENSLKIVNANLIRKKMEEYGMLLLKENDENRMIKYLDELKDIFKKNEIDMKSLGLVHFNFIENNIGFFLNLILNKIKQKMIQN